MKRTLLALSVIAAATAGLAGVAGAQQYEDSEGHSEMGPGPMGGSEMGEQPENCHLEIIHRIGRNGNSITTRRRVCD